MPSNRLRLLPAAVIGLGLLTMAVPRGATPQIPAQNDLDAFMQRVLTRRDDNWKKLQQYILEEHEQIALGGPGHQRVWGEQREYSWFIRDGYFVRSPLKFNGVEISEGDRVKYERDYLRRVQERDRRRGRGQQADDAAAELGAAATAAADEGNIEALIKQTREPAFISSAYFLRFKFETGKYALVGHEPLDGRDVLRIEYYPTKLFRGTDRRRSDQPAGDEDHARDREFQRLMNKVALVTLWVEPASHQIAKYTFDNVGFDFLPAQWLVHINDLHASMSMGQPFPDV
jgi:hypothetical protein